jgi:hypothetical protein
MAPFSTAFGGFLLSLVLWEEGVWRIRLVRASFASTIIYSDAF